MLQVDTASINQRCQLLGIHFFVSRNEPTRERERMPGKIASVNTHTHTPNKLNVTHTVNPVVHLTFSDPSVFSIVNSDSMHAIADHNKASARCLPGLCSITLETRILERAWLSTHQIRRPNPNTHATLSPFNVPSALKNRSGMNASGLGYLFSSCDIALPHRRPSSSYAHTRKLMPLTSY